MPQIPQRFIPQTTMRDVFHIIFRHKNKILIFSLTVIFCVGVATLLAPRVYESEAKLFIRLGRETVSLDPTATSGQTIQVSQDMENQINSEIEILTSRELALKVVDDIGINKFKEISEKKPAEKGSILDQLRWQFYSLIGFFKNLMCGLSANEEAEPAQEMSQREKTAKKIIKNLNIQVVKDSNVISLAYESRNPELAQTVLNKLITHYKAKHLDVHRTPGSFSFFKKQSKEISKKLDQTEKELKELKNEIGLASLQEQRHFLSEQISMLEQKLDDAQTDLASTRSKVTSLEQRLAEQPRQVVTSQTQGLPLSVQSEMQKRLNKLKFQKQELLSTYTQDSIPVREVQRQIDEAQALLAESRETSQVTKGVSQTYQKLKFNLLLEQGNLTAAKAKTQALQERLQMARQRLKKLNEAETRLAQLKREKKILEQNYHKYADSLEEARIDQALEMEKISNISVAQAPILPLQPIRPMTTLNLGLGFFLALFGGLGLAFFFEHVDSTLQKPGQIEELMQVPVLGSIENMNEK